MEWALDARSAESVRALRREVVAYLGRHAEPDADLAGAELVVAELLANALHHASGPVWVPRRARSSSGRTWPFGLVWSLMGRQPKPS